MVLVVLGSAMLRLAIVSNLRGYRSLFERRADLVGDYTLILALLVSVFAPGITLVRKILEGASERVTVFLYIYLPLSLISLLVVLVRNIY